MSAIIKDSQVGDTLFIRRGNSRSPIFITGTVIRVTPTGQRAIETDGGTMRFNKNGTRVDKTHYFSAVLPYAEWSRQKALAEAKAKAKTAAFAALDIVEGPGARSDLVNVRTHTFPATAKRMREVADMLDAACGAMKTAEAQK